MKKKKMKFNGIALMIMIGYYPNTCAEDVPDHVCDPCEDKEFGRVRSFGFIDKNFQFLNNDKTNAAEWVRGIEEKSIILYLIQEARLANLPRICFQDMEKLKKN